MKQEILANQKDHVSLATFAGRRPDQMAHNTGAIIDIELLPAAQGVGFRAPLHTSPALAAVHQRLLPFYDRDRLFAPDIERAKQLLPQGRVGACFQAPFTDLYSA